MGGPIYLALPRAEAAVQAHECPECCRRRAEPVDACALEAIAHALLNRIHQRAYREGSDASPAAIMAWLANGLDYQSFYIDALGPAVDELEELWFDAVEDESASKPALTILCDQAVPEIDVTAETARLSAIAAVVLDKARKAAGLKKKDIAARLGLPPSRVTRVLDGQANMTLRTIAQFALACGVYVELRTAKPTKARASQPDDLDAFVAERTDQNPQFPRLVAEAEERRKSAKQTEVEFCTCCPDGDRLTDVLKQPCPTDCECHKDDGSEIP